VELDLEGLNQITEKTRPIRPFVEEHLLENGRRIHVLGEGRLINLAAAEGHPSSVMDMSFANQALSLEWMASGKAKLENRVYPVPEKIDMAIAKDKLADMGIKIDRLTPEQRKYLASWEMGT
jgi:adenosylhomocysteinase